MIRIREIDHVVLRVVDLDRALAFYRDVLGCPLERRQDDIGLVQLRAGRSLIDLVPIDGVLGRAGGAAAGAEGEGPSLYIRDPDGNVVELKGPPDRSAATRSPP